MDTLTFSDGRLTARLQHEEDILWLALNDDRSGRLLGRSRLLALEVHDKACRRTERAEKLRIDEVERLEDGVHITVADAARGVRVGLWLRMSNGELIARLPITEVYEDLPDVYRLFAVDLLPTLLSCGPDGQLILPVGSGTLCSPRNKARASDRFLIYGEQDRWELLPLFPACATSSPDGGLISLATAGACETECRVATDGAGHGCVSLSFHLRKHWPDPVETETREIRFIPIPAKMDAVLCTAKRLRKHVMEDLGKPTLLARAKECPEVAYLLETLILKLFHAVERQGYMMAGCDKTSPLSFLRTMTFAECAANLKRIYAAGIKKVYTQAVGWNARGHDGWYPARFPIDERLGGEAGFRALIESGNALGYMMSAHDNFMMACRRSPAFDPECVVHDVYGEPLIHGWWAGGVECANWPLAFSDDRLGGHLRRMKALGLRGTYYSDYMAQPLEVNYHPRHRGSRTQCMLGMRRVQDAAREVFGSAGAENSFLHIVLPSDHCVSVGSDWHTQMAPDSWPIKALLERRVPLWHLALHGLVVHEGQMDTWPALMQTILLGGAPRDEWSAHPGVMPVLDDARIALLKAIDDLAVKRFGHLRALEMTGYAEPAPNVKVARFEDGTDITADFGKEELLVNGERIARPAAYGTGR
ncbi:MAG TPA: DUF5696 domain-containing protein [Planctomycetota bacterium]|jgi:hypothetical protein